jgi:capsular exopolysaccharide synthesis family protein
MKLFGKKKTVDSAPEKSKNVITSDSKFAIVEGYKIARTNLIFSLTAQENNAVAITSWSKGEGKSTATVNLAISFAKMGKRILLIDTDLRRPNLHNLLKLKNETGLTDVIARLGDFDSIVHRDVVTCLDVLTSGAIPPNPSELLASPVFAELMEKAKAEYDYVIMDTPPLGVVADTLLLKDFVGGYVLVVRERITTHGDIERALQNIHLADSKVLGFLKVGCDMRARGYGYKKYRYRYRYGYRYGYGYKSNYNYYTYRY